MPQRRSARPRARRALARAALAVGLVAAVAAAAGCTPSGPAPRSGPTAGPPAVSAGSPAAHPSSPAATATLATTVLATLATKGRAPLTGYRRARFGPAWTDDTDDPGGHNGCDTRNDILRRDLTGGVVEAGTHGCVLLRGTLHDPYTGASVAFVRGPRSADVQIDHVVALGDAWQTGAQQWSARTRADLANDPLNLLAVGGSVNESKGDGDAATWLPPAHGYRCAYVARQVAVKARYRLWTTPAEHAAAARVLAGCPQQTVPRESGSAPLVRAPRTAAPPPSRAASPPASPPASHAPSTPRRTSPAGCTTTSSGSCIRHGEYCPHAAYGRTGTDAGGRTWTCTGDTDHPRWG